LAQVEEMKSSKKGKKREREEKREEEDSSSKNQQPIDSIFRNKWWQSEKFLTVTLSKIQTKNLVTVNFFFNRAS
jgi:hypothetical protein